MIECMCVLTLTLANDHFRPAYARRFCNTATLIGPFLTRDFYH